jgi:hypothetical protein
MLSCASILWLLLVAEKPAPTPPAAPAVPAVEAQGPVGPTAPRVPVSPTPPEAPRAPSPPKSAEASKAAGSAGAAGAAETAKPVAPKKTAEPSPAIVAAKPAEPAKSLAIARSARRKRRERAAADAKEAGPRVVHAMTAAPSLSPEALGAELGRPASETDAAFRTVGDEQARLEKLGADIASARTGLREDTARLEKSLPDSGGAIGEVSKDSPVDSDSRRNRGAARPSTGSTGAAPAAGNLRGQVDVVSKALAGMKPEQAAAILTRLDRALAAEVLRRMKAADAGAAMGQLRPEVAAEIATEIAVRLLPRVEPTKERL